MSPRAKVFHFRHKCVTDTRALPSYRVCRGPGGPLGAVTARFDGGTA